MSIARDADEDRAVDVALPVVAMAPWRVTAVEVVGETDLKVRFVDGIEGTVHMGDLIRSENPGVFAVLRDPAIFRRVYLAYGAVTWPARSISRLTPCMTRSRATGTGPRDWVALPTEGAGAALRRSSSGMEPMPELLIRDEQPGDAATIRAITLAAFEGKRYSDQTEAAIVDALRAADAMAVSLVAVEAGEVVGHVAFSPVDIDGSPAPGWFGVGPVSVRPDIQGKGVGSALMRAGIDRLKAAGAKGCVLEGDPAYYRRFGFELARGLRYPEGSPEYFQVLELASVEPSGTVTFHPAFAARDV